MSHVTAQIAISLDGFVAGPGQSEEHPIGRGGMRLHEWQFASDEWRAAHGLEGGAPTPDSDLIARMFDGVGAHIMGRNMFSPGRGEWDLSWEGWWGDDPPYHAPVFVLTHHPRAPLAMQGGTTFHFVTDGIAAALDRAREAAGGQDVAISGGASTIRQYLAAGLLDELHLHIVPVLLGEGERLLQDVGDPVLEPVEVRASPGVTHVRYRVARPPATP